MSNHHSILGANEIDIFWVSIGVVAFVLYFLPTIIAFSRKHKNAPAIFALNFIAGWSFIGWVVSLVWALVK